MSIDKDFLKEVAQVMKTASEVGEAYTASAAENVSLTAKVAELESQSTEKQASGEPQPAPVFNDDSLDQTVDILISAGVAKEASRDSLLTDLQKDPNKVLTMVEKLAGADKSTPAEPAHTFGKAAHKTANADSTDGKSDSAKFWSDRFSKK